MIFVSHAWENGKPNSRVLQFVNFLREHGYQAECDVLYQQQKTAIHFSEMMADALRKSDKTIIILSENYKKRADDFQGGVGTEYRYIIDDFSHNENKYILVSFAGRGQKIAPDFLKGRDIVDLSEDANSEYRELFSKLSGIPKYEFSSVSTDMTRPLPQKIAPFRTLNTNNISSKLGLDFTKIKPISDLDKKKFIKTAFENIVDLIKSIAVEFCVKNQYFQIEYEEMDNVTAVFDIYKNESKIQSIQIWLGNLMCGRDYNIFVGNAIGSKNSFSQMIGCKEENGTLVLDISFGMFVQRNSGTVEDVVKQLWESFFQIHLR